MIGSHAPQLRNAWCDCIRGYAILLVCAAHALHLEPLDARFGGAIPYFKADTGVLIFYVLSGFLVTGILVREAESNPSFGPRCRAIGHFFVRRLFRLQPSFWLFLALYGAFAIKDDALSWPILLLPLSNWFAGPYVTWHIKTLHIEESYYLFIGGCAGLLRRALRPMLWWLLIAGGLGRIALFAIGKLGVGDAFWWLDRYLPVEAFAIGGLLALNLDLIRGSRLGRALIGRPALSFALAFLALLVGAALRQVKPLSYLLLLSWPLLSPLLSAVLIFSGLEVRTAFAPEWLRRIGLASYTLYLFQQFVFGPWQEMYGSEFTLTVWLGAFSALIVLLPLWYRFAEKPLTDLGSRWFGRSARVTPIAEPAVALAARAVAG